jgi:hypothetical protein
VPEGGFPLEEIWNKMASAAEVRDHAEVLKWEERMDDLMVLQTADIRDYILKAYVNAHTSQLTARNWVDHALAIARISERRNEIQRFRDQGEVNPYILSPQELINALDHLMNQPPTLTVSQ